MKFNQTTKTTTAPEFVSMLVDQIKTSALFVGDDFQFGSDRSGNFETLKQAGEANGFSVTNLHTLTYEDSRVSSTRIRECLRNGEFEAAEEMLGHPYSILGRVVYGRQIGRTLGVPTANLALHRNRAPIDGVYAVEMLVDQERYYGVANVGVRPTIEEETLAPILEVHL